MTQDVCGVSAGIFVLCLHLCPLYSSKRPNFGPQRNKNRIKTESKRIMKEKSSSNHYEMLFKSTNSKKEKREETLVPKEKLNLKQFQAVISRTKCSRAIFLLVLINDRQLVIVNYLMRFSLICSKEQTICNWEIVLKFISAPEFRKVSMHQIVWKTLAPKQCLVNTFPS